LAEKNFGQTSPMTGSVVGLVCKLKVEELQQQMRGCIHLIKTKIKKSLKAIGVGTGARQ
jgi:hypothetical protein